MSELANNKSIRKEVNDLGETLGIEPKGKTNQQKIRSIGEQAGDGTYATKEYVNSLMSGALKRLIVQALPEEDIDTNTIYMVLDQSSSQQGNVYNEYLYINNAWELIGTTEVETPHLYKHVIRIQFTSGAVTLVIDTPSNTAFTTGTLIQYLRDNGIVYGSGKYPFINVAPLSISTDGLVILGVSAMSSSNVNLRVTGTQFDTNNTKLKMYSDEFEVSSTNDEVTQIF